MSAKTKTLFICLSEPGQQLLKSLFQEFQNVKIVQESARAKRKKGSRTAKKKKENQFGETVKPICVFVCCIRIFW